ncbi:diaminohydroxyphosphoribosylaminopyrimidine deaminase/5-amino-6-(5-phosphoribosylamino)uracil reductase [Dysgonomonas alginatilytica]|uniref:Riboflavin biosynthesis protein RibD n=1 Tax=Dysgonomonas alginatilytica TaxID=1605892 RepID=A0A2V3PLZ7_9BACT|nr:bifunctional diaminohydroxyphosphoribosylaminopyrimidine deaminase/5-amino-6-(5-phosphoribosylamino)uracil reductase RibD [Dysgonomonas alginatilytica]PXV62815.1 diaminohydroxyphosphoribosylaminopyrimidine deaminase/5-amino-6-(5-phosphoribosylamino)uracil reductase [Dysgonomonas alginatilytica]
MLTDNKYMKRCLQLAACGKGYVAPNPMVGAVVVHNGKIIGEGYHRQYGKAHAEVNAINAVSDKSLLKESTIYVSLEPCSHYGKTPPCSQLIIDSGIPRVVIATLDPYHKVSGRGVNMLKEAGVDVVTGILEKEAQYLNKEFFVSQTQHRPYIYLKWAQTKDGFIDKKRKDGEAVEPTPISNNLTKTLVHKLRSEVSAIMIATNTAVNDNPSLTTRLWFGKNPERIILDRTRRIPENYHLFDNTVNTIIFTEKVEKEVVNDKVNFVPLQFNQEIIPLVLKELNKRKIDSLLVEGGAALLQGFIDRGAWDEAYIEVADKRFTEGTRAPDIHGEIVDDRKIIDSHAIHLVNNRNYKIL